MSNHRFSEKHSEKSSFLVKKRKRKSSEGIARLDKSLGVLTKKFMDLILSTESRCVDLKDAVKVKFTKALQVQKRRVYDIINVMEGIGLVQKKFKNQIEWIGKFEDGNELLGETDHSQVLKELLEEEIAIGKWTEHIQNRFESIRNERNFNKYAYLTYRDVRALPKLTSFENETWLIVNAPSGSNVEVYDPISIEEDMKYHVLLNSDIERISVFLVSTSESLGK